MMNTGPLSSIGNVSAFNVFFKYGIQSCDIVLPVSAIL